MSHSELRFRRAFERVLGTEVMAYVLHLRPLEWPIMTAHFLLGTMMAAGWAAFGSHGRVAGFGWFIFVALLNGGTLAINSAFDQDEGDIGYLRQPPKPPRYLLHVSVVMLSLSFGLGFLLPRVFAWSNALCVVMSVLYSVPPPRLKARAGWDLLINCIGFGLLTPLAGWGLTGRPLEPWFWAVCIGFAFLFGALYPATQIYQIEEDRARGDRTLVIRFGERLSLDAALVFTLLAHGCFAYATMARALPLIWIAPSLFAWLGVFLPWRMLWRRWTQARHEAGMYWALAAWAITDLSLLVLLWPR